MKDIPSQRGAALLRRWIAEGEHSRQDFKFMISDARKIARSISAFANREGGRLLIGVKDNGSIAGVRNEEDIYVVEQAAQIYCSPAQDVEFTAYSVDATTHVICASIARAQQRPVEVLEADGIRRAYYRIADENIAAHPLMVRAWRRRSENDSPLLFSLSESEAELLDLLDSRPGRHAPARHSTGNTPQFGGNRWADCKSGIHRNSRFSPRRLRIPYRKDIGRIGIRLNPVREFL